MYRIYTEELTLEVSSGNKQAESIAANISVVISLYNKIDYIGACIDSVLNQSYQPGEIIVVNDGSLDGSGEYVAKSYKDKVRLIQQNNAGVSIARNKGIDNSRFEYIALLDGDDRWKPDFLKEISLLIQEYSDCDVFATAYQLVHPGHSENAEYSDLKNGFRGKLSNYFKHSMGDWSLLSSSSTVIRKSKLLQVGKFKPKLQLGEDTELWCRLALHSNIAFINQSLAQYYCFNETSVSNTIIPDTELEYAKQLTRSLKNNIIPKDLVTDVKKFIAKGLQYLVREHSKRGNYRVALKFLLDKRLYFYYDKSTLKMLLAIFVPGWMYEILKTTRHHNINRKNINGMNKRSLFFGLITTCGFPWLLREVVNRKKITILLFHAPTLDHAKEQLKILNNKYNIIPLSQYIDVLSNRSSAELPPKSLIITFDDGVKENFELKTILENLKIPITIFLCSSIVRTNRHYWWTALPENISSAELEQVSNNDKLQHLAKGGFSQTKEYEHRQALSHDEISQLLPHVDFQSHTCFHPNLPQCTQEEAYSEIVESKKELESILPHEIYAIAFPNGAYSTRELDIVKNGDYQCSLTTKVGFNTLVEDKFQLKRIDILDTASANEVIVKASGAWHLLKRVSSGEFFNIFIGNRTKK